MTKICTIFIFRLLCSFNDLADLGGYIVQGNLLVFITLVLSTILRVLYACMYRMYELRSVTVFNYSP